MLRQFAPRHTARPEFQIHVPILECDGISYKLQDIMFCFFKQVVSATQQRSIGRILQHINIFFSHVLVYIHIFWNNLRLSCILFIDLEIVLRSI